MKFQGKESTTLEFKQTIPQKSQIVKTILGFCNLHGGRLVLGVADNGEIMGVEEDRIQELLDSISVSIMDSCSPLIIPQVYAQRIHDKCVGVIEVSAGMNKPYFLTSAGMNRGTYIRVGIHTIRATEEMIRELQWRGRGITFDETPVHQARVEDLDHDKVLSFLRQRRVRGEGHITPHLLKSLRATTEEHGRAFPTVGGILLFGRDPQRWLTELFVICTHFKGTSGREALAARDCSGDLFQQFEDAHAFVTGRLDRSFVIKGKRRQERMEIPEEAIREVLINAIVHRNYNLNGPIKVALYDNRLEVFSPGIFPGPMDVDNLEMGITYIRNVVIAKVFRGAGYVEKLGTGFVTIFESYRQRGLKKPQVVEGMNFIKMHLAKRARQRPFKRFRSRPMEHAGGCGGNRHQGHDGQISHLPRYGRPTLEGMGGRWRVGEVRQRAGREVSGTPLNDCGIVGFRDRVRRRPPSWA